MCDTALSFTRDQLLPFARDHLLPLLKEAANMIKGVPKEVAELKDELESIEKFINDADRMAEAEEDDTRHGIKAKIKHLREASFHIEDVIDEYMISEEQQPGCAGADLVKTMILRLQMAYKIQHIQSRIREMKDTSGTDHGFQIQSSWEQGPSNSTANQNATLLQNLREAPLYMDEAGVVGFEAPSAKLIDWLVKGRADRTVISVVGMGGQGKTTLAKKVFDSTITGVTKHFDCHAWINVSQSYTIEVLLTNLLQELYKKQGDNPPQNIVGMDRRSLIDEVRNYLRQKRYVIVFDDVWNKHFWNDIEHAVIDNKNGSKILITTRNMDVAMSCKRSSFVEVHELQLLTEEKSLELFNKKAFFDLNGCCPKNLMNISLEIAKKCKGLPIAIVAIGGLLSDKDRNTLRWQKFSENLSSELKKDSVGIKKILSFSYNDLSYNLKSCLLYFGIYPEDYVVESKRLIWQWIAEGFVKEESGKTLEEVAEGYLRELIRRSLVQVSSIRIDGKVKGCRVHDLLRVVILEKIEDSGFCKNISGDGQSSLNGIVRRLSGATTSNDLMASIESSHVRSLLIFTEEELSEYLLRRITTTYKLLKVLDFENASLSINVPENLGSLIHLKYLGFRNTKVERRELPKSIGMLQNLETLDIRTTWIYEIPKEVGKLRKLRHLLGDSMSLIQLKDTVGCMTFLQTLSSVNLDVDGVVELIRELGRLKKQLRELVLVGFRGEHGNALSFSIDEMKHLEKLHITSKSIDEIIDLHLVLPPPMLQNLSLDGKLDMLPEWIPKLQNVVTLKLRSSHLTSDPLQSLKGMQSLLSLSIDKKAYKGESLHFQEGGFLKLKKLYIGKLFNLKAIIIDKGALYSLEKLTLMMAMIKLEMVPAVTGIQHLKKLKVLIYKLMRRKGYVCSASNNFALLKRSPSKELEVIPIQMRGKKVLGFHWD